MKYIITESKLERAIIHFLNKMYGDLTEYRTDEYPDAIFYIRGKKIYMERDVKKGALWVDYETIWEDLENWFSLGDDDIEYVIANWVKETYNIMDYIPYISNVRIRYGVEETYNIKNR